MGDSKNIQVTIDDLAFDGKSVARYDGKVVFLNGGLPGEVVEADIFQKKPRYNRGRVVRIVEKAPERIEPRCQHFDHCGGCTWQDLDYDRQLYFKQMQVSACLERLGHLEDVNVHDIVPAPQQFFYRNKMEFSFHAPEPGAFNLGLHERGRFDSIFDVQQCHLQSEVSNRLVHWLHDYVVSHQLPVYDIIGHEGLMRFLVIREGKNTNQVMVNIVTNYGELPDQLDLVNSLRQAVPEVTTIIHSQNGQKSNIAVGEIETVLWGDGYIEEELMGSRFRIRANSFFQTNSIQAEKLYQIGFDQLQAGPNERVLDLYCGTGTIGILLAPSVAEVEGVELVPDAVTVASENAALNGLSNIKFHLGDVKMYLRESAPDARFDAIIVDPPRAGINPKGIKHLIKLKAPRILYISCNPATFARDAAALVAAGYQLPQVQPVDMFPHTMHIEMVGLFTLA